MKFIIYLGISFFYSFFQEPTDGFAKKNRKVQMDAQLCVAIVVTKPFKQRSRNVASANSIGVAMWNAKPA